MSTRQHDPSRTGGTAALARPDSATTRPSPPDTRPVAVVEDDADMRESVVAILGSAGFETVAFASGGAFLDAGAWASSSCVALDLRLGDISGLDVLARIDTVDVHCAPVVFISGHGDVQTAVAAMKHRLVLDFIEKPFDPDVFLGMVQRGVDLDARLRGDERFENDFLARLDTLSPREREVLERLADGHTNKQISFDLELSPKTVATHRANVLEKFGVLNILDVACPLRRFRMEGGLARGGAPRATD